MPGPPLSRRHFCQLGAGQLTAAAFAPLGIAAGAAHATAALAAPNPRPQPGTEPFPITEIRDGAYAIMGIGGAVLVVDTEAGPIVVDAMFAHTTSRLRATIEGRSGRAPAMLVNTHHHADHSGGNWALGASVNTIAHRNFNPRIEANVERYIEQARGWVSQIQRSDEADASTKQIAEQTFEAITEQGTSAYQANLSVESDTVLVHGGRTMELRHAGAGHTDNDLIVRFAELDVIHAGDLIFNDLWPFMDRPAGANTLGWQRSLEAIAMLCGPRTIVIPGHGELTDRAGVKAMSQFLGEARSVVQAGIDGGKRREEIAAMEPERFAERGFKQLRARALGAIYDELTGAPVDAG